MSVCPRVRFGDIVQLVRRPAVIDPDTNYPEVGVRSFGRGTFHKPAVAGSMLQRDTFEVKAGDLIVNLTFAWEGAVAIAQLEDDGRYASHRFYTFRSRYSDVHLPFLCAYWRSKEGLRRLRALSPGGAGRNRVLSLRRLLDELVPLPPIAHQQRMVAQLEAAEDAILMRSEIVRGVGREITACLQAAFKRITSAAPRACMADIAPLVRRPVSIDPNATYSEIGVRSFYRGLFTRRSVKGEEFDWQKLFRIESGDLVFSNLMAWEQAISIAGPEHAGAVGNHRMLTCEVHQDRVSAEFLFFYFMTEEGFRQVLGASPGTMVRNKTLSTKLLPSISVPLPSLDAQRWFNNLQAKARAAGDSQKVASQELEAVLPALLHNEFGGLSP